MGAGIRAEVSLPTSSPSPFDGVLDGSTPIYSVARSRLVPESTGTDETAEGSDGTADAADPAATAATDAVDAAAAVDTVVIEFLADADLEVPEGVETVFDYGRKAAYRFEVPCADESPFSVLDRHGVPATETVVRDGRLLVTFHASDLPTLRTVLEELQESCADMQVLRLLQSSSTPEESDLVTFDRSELTERQREVLSAAHDAGYFDHPKGANAGEVAAGLGIDRSTFSEHIAAAQRKILATVLD
ncbi:helix-turn-helix domain-containing protein [Halorubrum cibi]|uniref:HTH DNA binding domain n=1 Tax=Halorubrum cibi TaxID=413815 RepID=A0A521AF85_9EURY|nr:helix-turn-helix domain-containing protein [Halorubrum cibi]SMO33494.1 HTH DNA binding domain [Halorubrum cibi]